MRQGLLDDHRSVKFPLTDRKSRRGPSGCVAAGSSGRVSAGRVSSNRLRQSAFRQAEYFDLAPNIERYVKAAGQFAAWVWAEINARSAELIEETTTKAMELKLWHDENVGTADWFDRGLRHRPGGTVDSGGRGSAG
jgi:ribosomal protein S17